ncbi:MAG: hypothetical protein HY703_04485 [Gemmatimonadetes bacterium]|nr:hypothetical protein [Gemmatimonadota bacterium]
MRVSEPVLSRDHTERLLRAMGANLVAERTAAGAPAVRLEPPEFLEPLDLTVPGDFSSAAFFVALGLLAPAGAVRIRSVGVNPTRVGLLEAVQRMGATIELVGPCEVCGEPVADVVVRPSALRGTDIGGAEIPALLDEVPLLAVLAARATGETRITGAAELRVKESDRLAALAANLRALGVEAEELADGLVIHGTDRPLRGRVRAFGDHRVAMAFGVLAMLPGNRIDIVEPQVVRVSYPGYWRDLERCAAELSAV